MNKYLAPIIIVIAFVVGALFTYRFLFSGPEDAWLCENGVWVRHGNPAVTMPETGCGTSPVGNQIIYRNDEYKFEITLPDSWGNYSVSRESWNGISLDNSSEKFQGPKIVLRSAKWTQDQVWQDIPIMIFTNDEWSSVETEKMGVSAAPIPPSKLGEGGGYVFALPPRWVGFTDAFGQDEAAQATATFRVL
jgi:hypothetical protein